MAGLQTLKRLPAKRHIGVIGNMHELGEFAEQGYAEVAAEFAGLDILVLVGDLSPKIFRTCHQSWFCQRQKPVCVR